MTLLYRYLFPVMWLSWAAYWWLLSRNVKVTARHEPLWSRLLLAFVGSALARAEWRGVLAVVIALWALWRKLRFEERWLREQFGESYQAYSQRVAALVPFLF